VLCVAKQLLATEADLQMTRATVQCAREKGSRSSTTLHTRIVMILSWLVRLYAVSAATAALLLVLVV
jgi:hypothetical protein